MVNDISCRLGHGPFLFLEDVSKEYASSVEHRTVYRCVCLTCGKQDDYEISRYDRRRTVFTHKNYSDTLVEQKNIKKEYLEQKKLGFSDEIIVANINQNYK